MLCITAGRVKYDRGAQGWIKDFWKGGSYVQMCGVFALLILSHFS